MRLTRVLTAVCLVVVSLIAAPAVAGAAPGTTALSGAQLAGLATLQREIDETIAATGGTQTAVNQVSWDGGAVVLSFPMPAGTEFLNGAPPTAVADARRGIRTDVTVLADTMYNYGCPYGSLTRWFCLYQNQNFNGVSRTAEGPGNGRLLQFKDGGFQALHRWNFDNQTSSYVNNTTHAWLIYDWLGGNPNCGENDRPGAHLNVPAAKLGSHVALGFVGAAANDKIDCIWNP